jgi:peptide/nickel transport system substrate-binding protein
MRNGIGGARMRRAWAALALAAAAACGDGGAGKEEALPRAPLTGEGGERPEPGGVAVLAEQGDLERPMPLVWQSNFDSDLVDVMFMGLTRQTWRGGRLVYLLADESPMAIAWHWDYASPDSTALRYRMRSALRWSDGRPLTAADVVWTFRMLKDPRTASPRLGDVEALDSVRAENDSTVVFHFARRTPEMFFATAMQIAPRHAFEGVEPAAIRTHPVINDPTKLPVSGPFRVGSWRPGERVTLVPNPHFRPRPRLESIVIRVIPEPTTRLVELQTGRVDMVRAISADRIPALRQRAPNLRFEREQRRFWEFVAYNPRRVEAFRDPEVRRALGLALDVPAMIRALRLDGFTEPAGGPYPPILREVYDPQRMRPMAADTARARQILEARGWRDTDGDGVRDKDGKPLRFTLLTNAGNQRRADVALVIQQQWKAIGVDARLEQMETSAFFERQYGKDFEALLGGWGVQLNPDISALFEPEAQFNIVSFRDSVAGRLMREARAQPTAERANPLWRAAAERIVQQQPYTWLYYYDIVDGVSDRLRGMKIDSYGAYQNAWEWWIPRARQGAAGRPAPPADSARG